MNLGVNSIQYVLNAAVYVHGLGRQFFMDWATRERNMDMKTDTTNTLLVV